MDLIEVRKIKQTTFRRHPWEQARLKIVDFLIKTLKNKTIVDVGSGDAFIATCLSKKNPNSNILAVDVNYNAQIIEQLAMSAPPNLAFTDQLKNAKGFLKDAIDVILLMDVLEHVEEPDELLKSTFSLPINEKTTYLITVPAYQFLFSKHDLKLGHLKRYTIADLKQLLTISGFSILKTGYAFNSLVLIRFIHLIKEKLSKHKSSTEKGVHNWKQGRLISDLIVWFFWIEFKLSWYLSRFGIQLPGLTCYCLCRYSPQ